MALIECGVSRSQRASYAFRVRRNSADPNAENTAAAEMAGMVQLGLALLGARTGDRDAVTTHLSE
ncbi:MAG: hypothetical protein M3460_22975 [Actinomycetota bacterium]|nr:hypothetical protein [Actinomycetota bacterium]